MTPFLERVLALGDRLGPVRVVVEAARDDGLVVVRRTARCRTACELAWDFRHETWDGVEGLVRVDDPTAEPFRYLRLREPPYSDEQLREAATRTCATPRTSTCATRTSRPPPRMPNVCARFSPRAGSWHRGAGQRLDVG